MTLFKDAEKLWKVKVIAARQADFSQSQQDKLDWLLKEKYQLQRCCRWEENNVTACCIVVPSHLLPQNMFLHILYEKEELITYLRANQTIDPWESWFSLFTLHVQQKSKY